MKVAVIEDSLPLGEGVGTYSRHLTEGLRAQGIEVKLVSLTKQKTAWRDAANHSLRLSYRVLRDVGDCQVLHASSAITGLPFFLSQKPTVVTWHDLISLFCPNSGNAAYVKLLGPAFFRVIAFGADRIIAISEQTRDELTRYLGIKPEKIRVIYQGVESRFKPMKPSQIRPESERIIGYVGSFIRRKTVDFLIRAFSLLRGKHPELNVKLDIWGRQAHEYPSLVRLVEELRLAGQVRFMGFAPDESLPMIYNSFDIFAFPSEWEGFGFPILEAQRCGVPVIIRQGAHISPEVGRCCILALSEDDMADQMFRILTQQDFAKMTAARGTDYCQGFTWERTVRETIGVYEELVPTRPSKKPEGARR